MHIKHNFSGKHPWLIHSFSVLLFFSLLYTLFFSPIIFSNKLLAPGDGIVYYVPAFYSARTLWTDLILSGFPVAADPQVETWYPISLFFRLIPHSWNAFVVSAYVLASCFTYGYVYSLTNSWLAGLVSGIVYSMSGFMLVHLGHTAIIHTAAWMPLLIWAVESLRNRISPIWFVVFAAAITCTILAGHPQISIYAIGLSIVYVIVMGWSAPVGRWKYYRTCLAILFLGTGLAAIQIVPTAELGGMGLRSKMTFEEFVSFSLPLKQMPQFLFPYLFGGGDFPYNSVYFGDWNLVELSGYVGLLPLILSAIGLIAYRQNRHQSIAWFWLATGIITLLLALGNATPVARLMYYLPVYNKFRVPARHLIEMTLAVSVLAGFGTEALQKKLVSNNLIKKILLFSTGLVILSLVSIFLVAGQRQSEAIAKGSQPINFLPWTNAAIGVPLVIFLLAITVLICWSRSNPPKWGIPLLLLVVLIDLGSFGWFHDWKAAYAAPEKNSLTSTAAINRYREIVNQSKQRILPLRGGFGNWDEATPNVSRLWKLPSASGYGPLILSRYSELMSMPAHGSLEKPWTSILDRSLDIMSVRYLFAPPLGFSEQLDDKGFLWNSEDMKQSMGSKCVKSKSNSLKFNVSSGPQKIQATAIGIVSALGCSENLPNNTEVLRIKVKDAKGKTVTQKLLVGKDTAEWAYDCKGVLPKMKHQKAPIFTLAPTQINSTSECKGNSYLGILPLGQVNQVQEVQLQWIGSSGAITIQKLSLIDESTKASFPITETSSTLSDTRRWRYVENIQPPPTNGEGYHGSHVYENIRAMPRVWLVPEVISAKKEEVLNAIKSSKLPDGSSFDPYQVALVEKPYNFKIKKIDTAATTKIIKLADTQLEIKTNSASPAFMVLSDVYYPGWKAKIDGKPTKIFQTNYVLRGVQVPTGEHTIKFEFKPVSFHLGVGISFASLFFLGYLTWKLQQNQKVILTNQ